MTPTIQELMAVGFGWGFATFLLSIICALLLWPVLRAYNRDKAGFERRHGWIIRKATTFAHFLEDVILVVGGALTVGIGYNMAITGFIEGHYAMRDAAFSQVVAYAVGLLFGLTIVGYLTERGWSYIASVAKRQPGWLIRAAFLFLAGLFGEAARQGWRGPLSIQDLVVPVAVILSLEAGERVGRWAFQKFMDWADNYQLKSSEKKKNGAKDELTARLDRLIDGDEQPSAGVALPRPAGRLFYEWDLTEKQHNES